MIHQQHNSATRHTTVDARDGSAKGAFVAPLSIHAKRPSICARLDCEALFDVDSFHQRECAEGR